jgi:FMN phosphatase YigB (HAD superfamily)
VGDDSLFTHAQKFAVKYLIGWELFSTHPNGDVTVKVDNEMYRFDSAGREVGRTINGKMVNIIPPKISAPVQSSLSDDLTASIKAKPAAKPEKKYDYKPYPSKTICQEEPEVCHPREIKAVFWDADHTIWNMPGTAASVTGKLKKIDDNTVVELTSSGKYVEEDVEGYELSASEQALLEGLNESEKDFLIAELEKEHGVVKSSKPTVKAPLKEHIRTTIALDPTFRQTLDELDKRGIPSSIISLNTPGSVKRILQEFGLADRFKDIRDSYVNKGTVFKELSKKYGICPCSGMFVDDNRSNTDPVHDKCGMAIQIGPGKDIQKDIEVLKYIKGSA